MVTSLSGLQTSSVYQMSTLTLDSECKYVNSKMCKKNSYFISHFLCQVSIDEDLKDCREVSFQAALLYTSSKVIDGIICK